MPKHLSEDHKRKIGAFHKGKVVSEETKEKLRQAGIRSHPKPEIEMEKVLPDDTWPEPWECDILKMERRCLR